MKRLVVAPATLACLEYQDKSQLMLEPAARQGNSAGCRNLHRGMRLASDGGLLDVFVLRGLPVIGMGQWQQCYDSFSAIIDISLSL